MSAAGNDLSQTLGLITAANDAIRDPSSVGTMLKTISMRLRGASASDLQDLGIDTTGMSGGTKSIIQQFKHMAGIDIMQGTDYKSTYDILDELASKWKNLTDVERAALSEAVGGKRGGSIMASLMQNWQDAKNVVETANNSQGSAEKEQKNREKSIQVALNRFRSQVEVLIANFVDKGAIKAVIDGLTKFLNLLNDIASALGKIPGIGKPLEVATLVSGFLDLEKLATGGQMGGGLISAILGKAKDKAKGAIDARKGNSTANTASNVGNTASNTTNAVSEEAYNKALEEQIELEEQKIALSETEQAEDIKNVETTTASTTAEKAENDVIKEQNLLQDENITKQGVENTEDLGKAAAESTGLLDGLSKALSKVGNGFKDFATFKFGGAGSLKSILINPITAAIAALAGLAIASSNIRKGWDDDFDQAGKEVENFQQNVKNAQQTINELKQGDYDKLRNGVNENTNQNLMLSDEDYQKYLDYNNKIAALSPELVDGYDAQGNAIIKYAGNMKDLNDVLAENIKRQIQQADGLQDAGLKAAQTLRVFNTGTDGTVKGWFGKHFNINGEATDKDILNYANRLYNIKDDKERSSQFLKDAANDRNGITQSAVTNLSRNYGITAKNIDRKTLKADVIDPLNKKLDEATSYISEWTKGEAKSRSVYYDLNDDEISVLNTLSDNITNQERNKFSSADTSDGERIKMIEDMTDRNYQTLETLSGMNITNNRGETISGTKALSTFKNDIQGKSLSEIKELTTKYNDALEGELDKDTVTYLEYKFGLKNKNGEDISDQYEKKIDKILNQATVSFDSTQDKMNFKSLLEGLDTSTIDDFEEAFNNIGSKIGSTAQAYDLLTEARAKAASQASTNILEYQSEVDMISKLNQAISDSNGTNGLSKDDVDNITSAFQSLNGYDPSSLFLKTADGIKLDTQEYGKLYQQYVKIRKGDINDALKDQYSALSSISNILDEQGINLDTLTDKQKENLDTQQQAYVTEAENIQNNIELLKQQQAEYDGLTSSYATWQQAVGTPNSGAQNDTIKDYWKTAQDNAKKGFYNTDDMRSFVSMFTNNKDFLDEEKTSAYEIYEAWQKINTAKVAGTQYKWQDFYTDDSKGSERFLNALQQNGFAKNTKQGWVFDTNIDDVAKKFGTSSDVILNQFEKLHEVIDFDIDNMKSNAEKSAEQVFDYVDQMGGKHHVTIDVSATGNETLDQVESNINRIEGTINEVNNSTLEPKTKTAKVKQLLSDLSKVLKYQAQINTSQTFGKVTNAGNLTGNAKEGYTKVQEYYTAEATYQNAKKSGYYKGKEGKAQLKGLKEEAAKQQKELQAMVNKDSTLAIDLNLPIEVGTNGKIQWKTGKDEKGNKKEGLFESILNGSYTNGLNAKLGKNQTITLGIDLPEGETNKVNKQIGKITAAMKKLDGTKDVQLRIQNNQAMYYITTSQLSSIETYLQNLRNKYSNLSFTITTNYKEVGNKPTANGKSEKSSKSSGKKGKQSIDDSPIPGTNQSRAQGQNNAFADGKVNQSQRTKGKALVGELGTELLVRDGHYQTIGDNGAEMMDIRPNDIIFNHEQTEELLTKGTINGRGLDGFSYAKGKKKKKWWGDDHTKLANYGKNEVVHQPKQKPEYIGNVDINKRPIVKNGENTYSTTITAWQGAWRGSEENGHYIIGHFATILDDGTILSSDESDRYMSEVLNAKDPWSYDKKHWKLLYKIDNLPKSVQSDKQLYDKKSKWYKKADKYDIDLHEYQDKKQRKYAEQAGFISKGSSYANGKSLVGELGTELLVRDGHYQTVGDDGAEMIDVKPNDIIFNHQQTKQLLENGKINSRGKSFSMGNADDYDWDDLFDFDLDDVIDDEFDPDDDDFAYAYGKAYNNRVVTSGSRMPPRGSSGSSKKTKKKKRSTPKRSSTPKKSSRSNSNKSSDDWSDVSTTDPTNFDWIEVRLSRINDQITQLDYNVNRTYLRWGVRNKALNQEIKKTESLITNASKGSNKYLNKANSLSKNIGKTFGSIKQERTGSNGKKETRQKYSASEIKKMTKEYDAYAKKVREGKIQIQDIKNPDMAKAVQDYQTWYEKYRSARDQVQQAIDKRHDLRMNRLQQQMDIRDSRNSLYDTKMTGNTNRLDFYEKHGIQTRDDIEDWYVDNYKLNQKKITQLKKNHKDLEKQREELIDDALGVTSKDEDKKYDKAIADKKNRDKKLKKAFGTDDLDKIQKERDRIVKKQNNGKKLTKKEKTKLKSYNNNYKKAKSDTSTINVYNTKQKALDNIDLDPSEKKKYTSARDDQKMRRQRLEKAFGTSDLKKVQAEYNKIMEKQANGGKLTKDEQNKLKSYHNNYQKLVDDEKKIQKIRNDVAKTSKDVIDTETKIAQNENDQDDARYERVNMYIEKLDKALQMIQDKYDMITTKIDADSSRLDAIQQIAESKGYTISKDYYQRQIDYMTQKNDYLNSQMEEMKGILAQYPRDTKEYADAYKQIVNLQTEYAQNQAKIYQDEKAMKDIEWAAIERKHTYIGYLSEELSWLESIIEANHKLTDPQTGRFNDYGTAAMAMYAKQYETSMADAREYSEDIKKINEALAEDENNTDLQDKRQQMIQSEQTSITNLLNAQKSMSNLLKQQYDAELAALKTVLDYRKKELETQKSIYQYQKDITEKSRSVESLQKQLLAYQNDDSEEGKAKRNKLQEQLKSSKQTLQDAEYTQYISDQEEILDNIYTDFQNMFDDKMDDMEEVIKTCIKISNETQDTNVKTVKNEVDKYGYTITDRTQQIIDAQDGFYDSSSGTFVNEINGGIASITNVLIGSGGENDNSVVGQIKKKIQESIDASSNLLNKMLTEMQLPEGSDPINKENLTVDPNPPKDETTSDNTNDGGGKQPETKKKGDYKEYFSTTGKYTNQGDDINQSRYKRVEALTNKSSKPTKHKKDATGLYKYLQNLNVGNSDAEILGYWNAIHGDHKKKVGTILTQAEKKDVLNWFKGCYSTGGTIGDVIKASGEDGIILAKTGEEVLSLEKIKELQKALALLQPIQPALNGNNVRNIPSKISNSNTVGDVSIAFNLPNVTNYEEFASKLKNDKNMQKYIQQITIGEALGQNSLLRKKY